MERDGVEAGGGGVFFRDVVDADHPRRWKPTSSAQSSTSILGQQNSHTKKGTRERNGEEGGVGVVFFKSNSTCASAGQGDDRRRAAVSYGAGALFIPCACSLYNKANQAAGPHAYGPSEG
uniref:Uncharacterized protein n=1 Tax=Oryza glumipatula TaxID=40148 RepID=A0A0E0AIN5_9ORYZ